MVKWTHIFSINIVCEFGSLRKKHMTERASNCRPTAQAVLFSLFCKLFHTRSMIMDMQTKLVSP